MGGFLRHRRSATDPGVDGLCRKIVLDYAKQWTRFSVNRAGPIRRGKNCKKLNKRNEKKPTISGPLPADPNSLEGDKWRYVILTHLDAEPPPERPPRTKTRCASAVGGGSGRWEGSGRRRRRRQGRPATVVATADGGCGVMSAAELMELVLDAYRSRGRPPFRSTPLWRTPELPPQGSDRAVAERTSTLKPMPATVVKRPQWSWATPRKIGLFDSVHRVGAMVDSLLRL